MKIPHHSWETSKYKLGQKIQFIQYRNPDVVSTGTVVGWDTQDRILVSHTLLNGVVIPTSSVHIKRIVKD